jgi:multimeric flavodoxin WrbA
MEIQLEHSGTQVGNMKEILIISSGPLNNELTPECIRQASEGVKSAGGRISHINLNSQKLRHCISCDHGWGTCIHKHTCIIKDDYTKIFNAMKKCDGLIIISPVYFGDTTEIHKVFFDRLRRCEASRSFSQKTIDHETKCKDNIIIDNSKSQLDKKNIVLIAVAGGGGGGSLTCLNQMERYCSSFGGIILDRLTVTRYNRQTKLEAVRKSGGHIAKPPYVENIRE